MKLIEELGKSVAESIEMDKKSTYSGKIYGGIGLGCNIAALILALVTGGGFLSGLETGVKIWLWTLYPVLVFSACGLFFSVTQRLRGKYMSAIFSICLGAVCLLLMLAMIIVQASLLGKVYIYPFVVL